MRDKCSNSSATESRYYTWSQARQFQLLHLACGHPVACWWDTWHEQQRGQGTFRMPFVFTNLVLKFCKKGLGKTAKGHDRKEPWLQRSVAAKHNDCKEQWLQRRMTTKNHDRKERCLQENNDCKKAMAGKNSHCKEQFWKEGSHKCFVFTTSTCSVWRKSGTRASYSKLCLQCWRKFHTRASHNFNLQVCKEISHESFVFTSSTCS